MTVFLSALFVFVAIFSFPHHAAQQLAALRYYPSCAWAEAAGAAPIMRGQPGYRPRLDADADGVACEPFPV